MPHRLEAVDICQTQGQDAFAPLLFEKISFRWEAPGLHVIMGPSGGGKSSLLKTIGGVWKPRHGRILIDDESLWIRDHLNPAAVAKIGFAFQNNALFNSLRVLENLCFPHRQRFPKEPEDKRQALAKDWLKKVGLDHVTYNFPHELSGGMQKRLSIARTLILQPDFVFLDDPTAGLDPITSKQMAELVNSLLQGSESLVVIVTNDPDRARDWGPNIHYLIDKTLLSRNERAEQYSSVAESFR